MVTELEQIAKRIAMRDAQDKADRKRQRVLIRERVKAGRTWDQVQAEAGVARSTIMLALRSTD